MNAAERRSWHTQGRVLASMDVRKLGQVASLRSDASRESVQRRAEEHFRAWASVTERRAELEKLRAAAWEGYLERLDEAGVPKMTKLEQAALNLRRAMRTDGLSEAGMEPGIVLHRTALRAFCDACEEAERKGR